MYGITLWFRIMKVIKYINLVTNNIHSYVIKAINTWGLAVDLPINLYIFKDMQKTVEKRLTNYISIWLKFDSVSYIIG